MVIGRRVTKFESEISQDLELSKAEVIMYLNSAPCLQHRTMSAYTHKISIFLYLSSSLSNVRQYVFRQE